jgi:hypothetical protein
MQWLVQLLHGYTKTYVSKFTVQRATSLHGITCNNIIIIEQGMMYDVDADTGVLTPTQFDIKNNLNIPEVKAEFKHLYNYGIELIKRGMIDLETAKDCVKTRLIERTGLSPEEFDKWLGF